MSRHWSEDPYWTDALTRFHELRANGRKEVVIDLDALDEILYTFDGPAHRTLEAMVSVRDHEAMDGERGASRVILALLQILSDTSKGTGI